jgi:hypothetical protein
VPAKCLKMYLDDVEDVGDEVISDDLNPQRPTILSALVKNQRKDIFSSSQIERLVNVKWVKYGRGVFQRKFSFDWPVHYFNLFPTNDSISVLNSRVRHAFSLSHFRRLYLRTYMREKGRKFAVAEIGL